MGASNYKKYKLSLRKEFNYACVYCDVREPELGGTQSFHIDHYRPKSKFPFLEHEYNNLLYACRNCNQYKRDYWPSLLQQLRQEIVLNPREDQIDTHINKISLQWKGETRRGNWNLMLFRLNSPPRIEQREKRSNIEKTIKRLEKLSQSFKIKLDIAIAHEKTNDIQELKEEVININLEINTLKEKISGPQD
jgi:HNH endonuclease